MNTPLNTNSRILRVAPEGFSVAKGAICNSCGVISLCKPVNTPPACNDFSPLFVFRSPLIGFDGWFNTFRLGKGMFERFKARVGTVSTLYDIRKARVIGHAKIKGVAAGSMEEMLAKYAHTNHQSIGKAVAKDAAPDFLRAVLLRNYKTMLKTADLNDPFTVIFLERCDAPVFAKQEAA